MSGESKNIALSRINQIVDENSFLELGSEVNARSTDFSLNKKSKTGDGVVTGYGLVDGIFTYIYATDPDVLAGSIGEMGAKKIIRLYEMAEKNNAPIISLIDSRGLRLYEASDSLNSISTIYKYQSKLSGVVTQVALVFGTCGGAGSILTSLCDFVFMEKDARLFINSPDCIKNNTKDKLDTASSDFVFENTINVDYVGSENDIIAKVKELISFIPSDNYHGAIMPFSFNDDSNRVCDINEPYDEVEPMLAQISDNGFVFETKRCFAKDIFTGFIALDDTLVAVIANRHIMRDDKGEVVFDSKGRLTGHGILKATKFIKYADAFNIPVLTLTNVKGLNVSTFDEQILSSCSAELIMQFTNATVPKLNLITGNTYGSAYLIMNSFGLGCDITFAYENVEVAPVDTNHAIEVIGKENIDVEPEEYRTKVTSSLGAASRGYIDKIIYPADTRKYLISALNVLVTKDEQPIPKKHVTK